VNRFQLAKRPLETVESHKRSGRSSLRAVVGVLAGIVFLALPLPAQNRSVDGIYRGAIGNQEIVVELRGPLDGKHAENYADARDSRTYPIQGHYFYRRHGVSIDLVGTPQGDGILRLREYRQRGFRQDAEFTADWRLTMGESKATGTFCKCDLSQPSASAGPQQKISLTRVSRKLTPDSGWQNYKPNSGNTYLDLLLDFPLQRGPEIQVSPEVAYRMRTDPRFKVSLPRLTRFPNAVVMARINRDLDAGLTDNRLRAAAFSSVGEGVFGGFYDETTSVNFFLPHVLSLLVQTQWYYGGAHPNEGGYSHNYNLHTGKRFALEEVFQTSSGGPAEAESAAILAKLYLRHFVKPVSGEAPVDNCEEIVREVVSGKDAPFGPLLYLSQKGLVIDPPLPRAVQVCGPAVTVPYRELRPFVKRGTILRLLVDARTINK